MLSSICWSTTLTPAISAIDRTATTGAMVAGTVRPASCGRMDLPGGGHRGGDDPTGDESLSHACRALRPAARDPPRHRHHHAAEEGHPPLLDERTDAARAWRAAAGGPRFHAAVRARARGSCHARELVEADLDARRD